MEDVYKDVGLSAVGDLHGCDLVVRDIFASKEHGSDDKVKCGELGDVEFGCADIYEKQQFEDVSDIAEQFKDFAFEIFDGDGKTKIYEDQWLNLNIAAEPYFNLQSISDVQAIIGTTKSVNLASSVQEVNSVKPASFEDAERDYKQANVVQERFQSRWLGGWTQMEEVKAFEPSKHDVTKKIPQLLVPEISFLSESADIAPDQNSFVQKDNEARDATSQPSIPFEGLGRDANEDILCSVDIVRCSIQSVTDPLCSIVPCSISSEKAYSFLVQKNHNDDIDAEKCSSSVQEHNMNIFQTTLDPDIKSVNKELLAVPSSNCEDPQYSVCRSVTSLRAYSMMLPSNYTLVEKRTSCFTPSIPLECNAKLIPSAIENGARDMTNEIRSCNATTKDEVDFPSSAQKMRSNHIITNKTDSQFQPVENVQVTIEGTDIEFPHFKNIQLTETCRKKPHDTQASERKRVHFSDNQINYSQKKKLQNFHSAHQNRSRTSASKRLKGSHLYSGSEGEECKGLLTKCVNKVGKSLMLKNIEFLLTGFSTQKEREIKSLIRKYGGIVLSDIPSPPTAIKISTRSNCRSLPVILSCKKLQTLKFLYGCAVNACILAVKWLTDSIAAGSRLPPQEYTILPNYVGKKYTRVGKPVRHMYMFDRVGIVFHGKPKFCTKMAKIIKHGGGRVFRGLQWLVQSRDAKKISLGVIVAEDESRASRHLKHCALEQSIPLMPSSWIVKSLHVGKLLPFVETKFSSHLTPFQPLMSEEI